MDEKERRLVSVFEDENTELVRSYIDMWKQIINVTGK